MSLSYESMPGGLPVPVDDGGAAHLPGTPVPEIELPSTGGRSTPLAEPDTARTVLYLFPRMGVPGVALPEGWDLIPGARGCTPEACAFRDHHAELAALGAAVRGLSSQSTEYQAEAVDRLRLPFPMLSDPDFRLAAALRLPTFQADGTRLYARLTMVLRAGTIEHVFYPVFPPDGHAAEVLNWLAAHPVD